MLILPGFAPSRRDGEDRAAVREAVVSGFCAYSLPVGDPDLAAAIERRLPLVVVDEPRTSEHTFVGIDDRAGARLAAEHLSALGHRRIGVVSFRTTDDHYAGPLTPAREAAATYPSPRRGWPAGATASRPPGSRGPRSSSRSASSTPARRARRACGTCSPATPAITAVLCSTDQIALGVMAAAAEAGRQDLSIVGFDDIPRRGGARSHDGAPAAAGEGR